MTSPSSAYVVEAIPDDTDPRMVSSAGGDVATGAYAAAEHFLRTFAQFEPGSVSVAIMFAYEPRAEDPQCRLTVRMEARAHSRTVRESVRLLLERGPLNVLYPFRRAERMMIDGYGAACDVTRRLLVLAPTVTAESNPKVLPRYLLIHPLVPRRDNDYLQLASLLSGIEEPVLVDIRVEPADAGKELARHTIYLSQLGEINHSWRDDDEDAGSLVWGKDERLFARPGSEIRPLRVKEQLVEDILRNQRRVHETLTRPHLTFQVRVFAQSPDMAHLVASVVAESAFEGGSYSLFDSKRGEPLFDQAIRKHKEGRVLGVPLLEHILRDHGIHLYDDLATLSNLAPVDELMSVFRLPVASHGFPNCIRKNTDPPREDPHELIVIGYDEAFSSGGFRHDSA